MKKYLASIMSGILLGSLVALISGNTITGVLFGVITATMATWMMSLNWSWQSVKKFGKIFPEFKTIGNQLADCATSFAESLHRIRMNPEEQKVFAYWVVVAILTSILGLISFRFPFAFETAGKNHFVSFGLLSLVAFFATAIFFAFGLITTFFGAATLMGVKLEDLGYKFMYSWVYAVQYDGRKPLSSVMHMLLIRTINALKLLAYLVLLPFIFFIWAVIKLSTVKTCGCAFCSGFLTAIHLIVCYQCGWINYANINFWQSTILFMIVGGLVGKYLIHQKIEFKFPRIQFLEHLPA